MAEHTLVDGVRLTSPDKRLDGPITKEKLARYYAAVAPVMLPHVANRPLSLVRCPGGRGGRCFMQKHPGPETPDAIRRIEVEEREGAGTYAAVDDAAGLVALAQLAAVEVHVPGSRHDRPDQPDRLVFDLDPGGGIDFDALVAAAREVRERLEGLGLSSVPLLTGSRGIHVVVHLQRGAGFDEARAFTRALAERMEEDAPDRYVARARRSEREGRIFIDYLRNGRGTTAVAPCSPRNREGLPVATPVRWDELGGVGRSDAYPLERLLRRLRSLGDDPWGAWRETRQRLSASMLRAVGA